MHIPDGFIDVTISLGAGAIAAGGVALAARRAAAELDERRVPLAGAVAAFLFAAQMLNFPVAPGTSGHLMGGVLAAVLVGPSVAILSLTVVVFVQALFADGGLTALGLNVLNVALLAPLAGYAAFRGLLRLLPKSPGAVPAAAGIAGGFSVVVAAGAFVVEFAMGGTAPVSLPAVLVAMVGVHTFVAIGEGVVTALAIGTILKVRPDLVAAAEPLAEAVHLVPAEVGR